MVKKRCFNPFSCRDSLHTAGCSSAGIDRSLVSTPSRAGILFTRRPRRSHPARPLLVSTPSRAGILFTPVRLVAGQVAQPVSTPSRAGILFTRVRGLLRGRVRGRFNPFSCRDSLHTPTMQAAPRSVSPMFQPLLVQGFSSHRIVGKPLKASIGCFNPFSCRDSLHTAYITCGNIDVEVVSTPSRAGILFTHEADDDDFNGMKMFQPLLVQGFSSHTAGATASFRRPPCFNPFSCRDSLHTEEASLSETIRSLFQPLLVQGFSSHEVKTGRRQTGSPARYDRASARCGPRGGLAEPGHQGSSIQPQFALGDDVEGLSQ